MRNVLIGCVIAAVAFVAGRLVPQRGPDPDPTAAVRSTTVPASSVSARAATAGPPTTSELRRAGPHATAPVFPEWADAVRADPAAARRTYDAVLLTLESRRHLSDDIERCVGGVAADDVLRLRFAVNVTATGEEVAIGDARFLAVASGAASLGDDAARCLELHLAGSDRLPAEAEPFLDGYQGRIEYVAAFAPSRPRAPAQRVIDAGPGR